MAKRPFTVTLEPVGGCNLDCTYCYSRHHSEKCRGEDFFLDAIAGIAGYAVDRDFDELHCVWLGGEPLLAGIHFFERVASLASTLSSHLTVRNFVQTNGLLLDSGFCRLFRNAGFHVGVSIDGPPSIHDAFRVDRNGEPTHLRVLESIARLREHNVPFGCVAVITRLTLGREEEVYDFFRTLGCGFRINPVIPGLKGSSSTYRIEPEEYGASLLRFFNAWSLPNPDRVNVSPLDNYVMSVISGEPRECQHQLSCAASSIGIKPGGEVTICGRFQDMVFGNVRESPIAALLTATPSSSLATRGLSLDGCRSCRHWHLCHGGCPHNALVFRGDMSAKDPFCPAYKVIFSHIEKILGAA